jgi:hypothetical protein
MRLIDADRLKDEIMGWSVVTDDLFGMGKYHEREIVLQAIEESPTINAAPVVRGEWTPIFKGADTCKCSVCKRKGISDSDYGFIATPFCPNCGAKMEVKP